MTIKTTRRNHLFIVQKRVGKNWQMITDAVFKMRSHARECSNELNNIAKVTGRGPNRRYRVAKLVMQSR